MSAHMSATQDGPMAKRIREKLTEAFDPVELVVEDQSAAHAGHAGARGLSGESHFHVRLVSDRFRELPRIARHRVVQQVLAEEMPRIHALSLDLHEPANPKQGGGGTDQGHAPKNEDPETGKSRAWATKDTTKGLGLPDGKASG